MSGGILRFPWTSQPQTPVGLKYPGAFYGVGPFAQYAQLQSLGSMSSSVGSQGRALVNNGTANGATYSHSIASTSTYTIIVLAEFSALGSYEFLTESDTSVTRAFQLRKSSTDGFEFIRFDTGNNAYVAATSAGVIVANKPYVVAGRTIGPAADLFVTGIPKASIAIGNTPSGISNLFFVGGGAGGAGTTPNFFAINGKIYGWVFIPAALSDAEINSVVASPSAFWQLFAPIQRTIWVPASAGGATYTLPADSASYSLTGQTTGLAFNRVLTADTTSYALTGQAATLAFNRAMVAASAAYTLTGQDVGLRFNRVLAADTTAYTLTGQNVTLTYTPISGATYTLAADTASYALTGQDTGLLFNRVLTADTTAYTLTGQAVGLSRGYTLTADTAAYSLTGSSASFVYNRVLAADGASYALTGQDVTLTYTPLSLPTIGRPASDTSNTGWLPSTGSDLYAMLDEVVPDDADYIYSTAVGQICEMPLDTTSYPGTASQTLKFRGSSSTGNSVIVRLKNTGGATVRTVTQALTVTDTEYDITLTSGEIAAITSGALSVQLESA